MRTCWQIRNDLSSNAALPTRGSPDDLAARRAAAELSLECRACSVFHSGASCWEQCEGCDRCCAPIHVSCDFCFLYIEHRREIAHLVYGREQAVAGARGERLSNLPIGGRADTMERLQLNVPDMYGDHHVLRARAVLVSLDGVEDVVASASFRHIALSYDPARVSIDAIHATLAGAGYPVAPEEPATIPVMPVGNRRGDPAWDRLGVRIAATDARDAKANR